jgi:hypothetical protein
MIQATMQECTLSNGRKVLTTQDPTTIKKILDELLDAIDLISPSNSAHKKQTIKTAAVKLNKCGVSDSDLISLFIRLLHGISDDFIYSAVNHKKSTKRKSKINKKRLTQERMIIRAAATDIRRGCGKKRCIEEAIEELHKLGHSKRKIIELLKNRSLDMVNETFMIRVVRKYKFNRVVGKASTKEEIPQDVQQEYEDQQEEKQPQDYNTQEDVEEITDLAKAKAVCCNALNRRDYFEQELKTSQKSLIQAMEQHTYNMSLNIKALQLAKEHIPIVVIVQLLSSTPVDVTIDYDAIKEVALTEEDKENNSRSDTIPILRPGGPNPLSKVIRCNKCDVELPNENWYKSSQLRGGYLCKGCYTEKKREYYISKKRQLVVNGVPTNNIVYDVTTERAAYTNPNSEVVNTVNLPENDNTVPQINKTDQFVKNTGTQYINHKTQRYAELAAARLDALDKNRGRFCDVELTGENWSISYRQYHKYICRPCNSVKQKEYNIKHQK